jgi:hypothetical protein
MVNWTMLPFELNVAVAVVAPFPSKVCVPTSAVGPAMAAGAITVSVSVYAKVPAMVAVEHPLSAAFAVGAVPRAIAAIAKAFAMVLCFIFIS